MFARSWHLDARTAEVTACLLCLAARHRRLSNVRVTLVCSPRRLVCSTRRLVCSPTVTYPPAAAISTHDSRTFPRAGGEFPSVSRDLARAPPTLPHPLCPLYALDSAFSYHRSRFTQRRPQMHSPAADNSSRLQTYPPCPHAPGTAQRALHLYTSPHGLCVSPGCRTGITSCERPSLISIRPRGH